MNLTICVIFLLATLVVISTLAHAPEEDEVEVNKRFLSTTKNFLKKKFKKTINKVKEKVKKAVKKVDSVFDKIHDDVYKFTNKVFKADFDKAKIKFNKLGKSIKKYVNFNSVVAKLVTMTDNGTFRKGCASVCSLVVLLPPPGGLVNFACSPLCEAANSVIGDMAEKYQKKQVVKTLNQTATTSNDGNGGDDSGSGSGSGVGKTASKVVGTLFKGVADVGAGVLQAQIQNTVDKVKNGQSSGNVLDMLKDGVKDTLKDQIQNTVQNLGKGSSGGKLKAAVGESVSGDVQDQIQSTFQNVGIDNSRGKLLDIVRNGVTVSLKSQIQKTLGKILKGEVVERESSKAKNQIQDLLVDFTKTALTDSDTDDGDDGDSRVSGLYNNVTKDEIIQDNTLVKLSNALNSLIDEQMEQIRRADIGVGTKQVSNSTSSSSVTLSDEEREELQGNLLDALEDILSAEIDEEDGDDDINDVTTSVFQGITINGKHTLTLDLNIRGTIEIS